jgi:sensor histidine kinase YesM
MNLDFLFYTWFSILVFQTLLSLLLYVAKEQKYLLSFFCYQFIQLMTVFYFYYDLEGYPGGVLLYVIVTAMGFGSYWLYFIFYRVQMNIRNQDPLLDAFLSPLIKYIIPVILLIAVAAACFAGTLKIVTILMLVLRLFLLAVVIRYFIRKQDIFGYQVLFAIGALAEVLAELLFLTDVFWPGSVPLPSRYSFLWLFMAGLTIEFLMFLTSYFLKNRYLTEQYESLNFEFSLLSSSKMEVESALLLSRLNPHTLNNFLNRIQHAIAFRESFRAMELIHAYSGFITGMLKTDTGAHHSVADEIRLIEQFVSLEKDRLPVEIEIVVLREGCLNKLMPAMLTVPVIENCLTHGYRQGETNVLRISLEFRLVDQDLQITVCDNGVGLGNSAIQGTQYGLDNVRKRLNLEAMRLGGQAVLELKNRCETDSVLQGTCCVMRFPVRQADHV